MSAVRWLGGWLLFIAILLIVARTTAGRRIIGGVLWLSVIVLIVVNWRAVVNLINPSLTS